MKIHIPEKTVVNDDIISIQPAFDIETNDFELLPVTVYFINSDHTISTLQRKDSVGNFTTDGNGNVVPFRQVGKVFRKDDRT